MELNLKIRVTLAILAMLFITSSSNPIENETQLTSSFEKFSQNLFTELDNSKNIIVSPFCINSALAMLRMGAEGETAVEMDSGLHLNGQTTKEVAESFHSVLAKYANSGILNIANKVYVNQDYVLQDEYNEVLANQFMSTAENVDFGNPKTTKDINEWVASKTNNIIKELVQPGSLASETLLFLISAIHFKAQWRYPFEKDNTREADFYTDESNTVKVQMMYKMDNVDYDYLSELETKVVRLPYKKTDISMMIFLPNKRNGLSDMIDNLKKYSLENVAKDLQNRYNTRLALPKFKAEFEVELAPILEKMGMHSIFANPDFGKMLNSTSGIRISKAIHKAVIEVDEVGTEAAAVTGLQMSPLSGGPEFIANHPFYYVLVNEDFVPLFQGTFIGV